MTPFFRALLIVTLTSLNVVEVSRGFYLNAFFTGGVLSFVWWGNTRTASRTEGRAAQFAYALGAGCGTVLGMFIGRHL